MSKLPPMTEEEVREPTQVQIRAYLIKLLKLKPETTDPEALDWMVNHIQEIGISEWFERFNALKRDMQPLYQLLHTVGMIDGDPNGRWEDNEDFGAIKLSDLSKVKEEALSQQDVVLLSEFRKRVGG